MPYIKQETRRRLDDLWDELGLDKFVTGTDGQLNYIITKLIHNYIRERGINYNTINACIGILECAKLELYRMIAAPYENKKRIENDSVSELDSKTLEDVR